MPKKTSKKAAKGSKVAARKATSARSTKKKATPARRAAAAPRRAAPRRAAPRKAAARKAAARKKVQAVPEQYRTVTSHLVVSPCTDALEFYARAFGAEELSRVPGPGGRIMHAEMRIGDSVVMLADEMPPMPGQAGTATKTPKNAGATTGGLHLYVKNADAAFERAVNAGASVTMPLQDVFWGDRYGQLEDPFGHHWSIATHLREVSPEEIDAAMAQMAPAEA